MFKCISVCSVSTLKSPYFLNANKPVWLQVWFFMWSKHVVPILKPFVQQYWNKSHMWAIYKHPYLILCVCEAVTEAPSQRPSVIIYLFKSPVFLLFADWALFLIACAAALLSSGAPSLLINTMHPSCEVVCVCVCACSLTSAEVWCVWGTS